MLLKKTNRTSELQKTKTRSKLLEKSESHINRFTKKVFEEQEIQLEHLLISQKGFNMFLDYLGFV